MAYGFLTGFFLSLSIPSVVNGLTCYSCSYYENEIKRDYECVVSPANVTTANTVQCPDDSYCFTQIQYHKDSVVVRSITRGCGTQPLWIVDETAAPLTYTGAPVCPSAGQ
uniref:Uncharacterized protein LOC111127903 n=1 Tax=Crassostrea virginica TaxID=6565 RepID=A0A8B8DPP2_CRAVI|nr:uncharacterized protein LOC111127903 [Crassostrea virginica]